VKANELITILKKRLGEDDYTWQLDEKTNKLRIEHKVLGKGLDMTLGDMLAKYEERGETAIEDVIYTIDETFKAMHREQQGFDGLANIYPVIRSGSFPKQSKEGFDFITTAHTAETTIYYALDLGRTYRLIDTDLLEKLGIDETQMKEAARFKVRELSTNVKTDEVAGNTFYFLNENDGYDASRLLNESFLQEMRGKIKGEMAVAVPHQDVLIIADIQNPTGYDVLAQMTMHFFAVGTVPITSLSFIYEAGKLEPIFIMAKNRKKKED
jgi:uncharacterized protein YtpQ (UPF0354 family)